MNYEIWSKLRQTFAKWNEHEAPRLGAALAFYTILSLAPLVILVIAILALFSDIPLRHTNCFARWRV